MRERTVPLRRHLITALNEEKRFIKLRKKNHHIAPSHLPSQGLDHTYTT